MPELPEVETTRRGIEPWLVDQQVERIDIRQSSLRWPIPVEEMLALQGLVVRQVRRRAKYLLVDFDHGSAVWHLGMSGSLRLVEKSEPPKKHDHVDWYLENGKILRFHDPRRFGALLWQSQGEPLTQLANLGPEPLEVPDISGLTAESLYQASRGKRQAVKLFIMDSRIVVGVGNIYANESLFLAGIRPTTPAGKISLARYERLLAFIRSVLSKAVEQGGTTLRDFVNSDGSPGYFAQQLNVYGRGGEACPACQSTLKEIRLGQRSTVYCAQCQR
ncbi:MAG: DNA-formamidopyrimidine glycosylase [Oceanospirillaceae bacterium]|nr:DNA-formamidopyrimidine glycosylase [Oceanospirillaceae bacterium]